MRLLFLLFIVLPIVELMLLFKVGQTIGALPTIAIVLLTATIGVRILRHQSFSTLRRAQERLQSGELPGQEIVEGFMISIGGALLLTPGFITDVIAIALLRPAAGYGYWRRGLHFYPFWRWVAPPWRSGRPGRLRGRIQPGRTIRTLFTGSGT